MRLLLLERWLRPRTLARDLHLAVSRGNYVQVREVARAMLDRDDDDEEAHFWACEASLSIGDYESALQHSRWLVDHGSKPEHGYRLMAHTCYRLGHMSDAIHAAESAVKIRPGWFRIRMLLGAYLFESGDALGAVREFRTCVESREPEPVGVTELTFSGAYARFKLGRALAGIGDLEGARRELQKVAECTGQEKLRNMAMRELQRIG